MLHFLSEKEISGESVNQRSRLLIKIELFCAEALVAN